MKQTLLEKNINNLTSLWKKLGAQQFTPDSNDIFQCPGWPNRHWLDAFSENYSAEFFAENIENLPLRLMVPVWGINTKHDEKIESQLRNQSFEPVLLQTGMYLDLPKSNDDGECDLDIKKVETPAQVTEWTSVASTAFGYVIDEAVIAQLPGQADIDLLLVHEKSSPQQAVATALLFATGDTIGVHMVGVAPHGRGKGIAMQLMKSIISQAKQQGYAYMTLQASSAGEGIYRKLGFQQQFVMRSFKRIQN